jgi:hypothetical protein
MLSEEDDFGWDTTLIGSSFVMESVPKEVKVLPRLERVDWE